MESRTRIKVVAFALMAVFLASVAVASFASASNSNTAGQGVYLTFAMSKVRYQYLDLTSTSYISMLSISVPYISYSAWYNVVCDGYTYLSGADLGIGIGVDGTAIDDTTYRFYGYPTASNTQLYSGIHSEELYYLGPGAHTFHFLGQRNSGTGTCRVMYFKITVTFFTDAYVSQVAGGEVSGSPATG